jgi:hypothetical protein
MRVEQAIYGEVRGGHALRLASDCGKVSPDLTSRLDLPDTAPPGAYWSPFLSGFPHGDRYVLARTFSDPAATRAGMVLSHAVIAPLDELTTTADLRPLLALLIATPEAPETLEAREVSTSAEQHPLAVDLVATAVALTTRGAGPVVRIGCQSFEDLMISLWFYLWPEIRNRFAFRLSFGPQDLVEVPKPSLVCTPTALGARWAGHRIVEPTGPKTISRATALLSGGAEGEPLLGFAREIGARIDHIDALSLLERAYELRSISTPTFDECVAVLRLVERLSPDSAAGLEGKATLAERLISCLPEATVGDILLLRNLGTEAFPGTEIVWAGLRAWALTNRFTQAEDELMLSAINDATAVAAAIPAWREALLGGIADASRAKSSSFPAAFWRWADARPATLIALADHLPAAREVEARLADAAPRNLRRLAGDTVMELALTKHWLRLHGAAAGATLAPLEAVRRQLSVDTDSANMDGLRAALFRATPTQALDIALKMPDARILQIAAEEVARKPELLKHADFRDSSVQDVWARALTTNAGAWRGPADPQEAFTVVIEEHIQGRSANANLLATLSLSPLADLSDYPRRSEVWPRVGTLTSNNLLKATAAGWLKRATSAAVPYAPDRELEAVLLTDDALERTLFQAEIGAAVRIVSALSGYDETRFLHWLADLAASRRALATTDAEALGYLVLERRWQRAVSDMVNRAGAGRQDLKPALRICHKMVSIFSRWWLGVSPVSHDEKWQILEDLTADLYPTGPDHNELWDRAGGRQADLQSNGNGRTRWHNAIGQIRHGKGPHAARLLEEMSREHPRNDQLRRLAADPDFGGGYG